MNLTDKIPISRIEYPKLILSVFENSVLHVFIKQDALIELVDIRVIEAYIKALGPKKYLNLFEFANYASADDSVRKWASDPAGNHHTIADALVINGLDQKLIGEFYLKMNQPVKPTKLFNNTQDAIAWLLTFSLEG